MLGNWYAMIETPKSKLKIQFKVGENNDYTLAAVMEPLPIPLEFTRVQSEGNKISGFGKVFWNETEEFYVHLSFEADSFTGEIYVPSFGHYPLSGERGQGPYLAEALIAEVASYRKENVSERSDAEIHYEIDQLLIEMTLEEKVGQMLQCQSSYFSFGGNVESDPPEQLVAEGRVGSILGAFDITRVFELQKIAMEQSRLKIPLLFHNDVIHGSQTIFPIPLGWSSSWNPELVKEANAIAAKEASASGITFNHGPMIDISQDARWGRVAEGAGEDPYLGGIFAKAQVEGFQGNSLFDKETLIACLKHFIGYGMAEGGRDYNTVDISEATLRNNILPPFEAGIEAGAGSVMNSFNIYQGVPVAASTELLRDLLREELGFEGVLISDYGSIDEIRIHGHARTTKEAAQKAVKATMDVEMVTRAYDYLPELVQEGKVSEQLIDDAVRRILYLKYKTGLMDDPFRYILPEKEKEYHFHQDHLEASLTLAEKSIVLLKNDHVLPMKQKDQTIALVGPFADSKDLLGPWQFSRYKHETVSLYEGILNKGFSNDQLLYAQGSYVNDTFAGGIEQAVVQAKKSDIVILALGENSDMSGEAASRMDITIPEAQQQLAEAIIALGKPTILVLTNGRPLVLDWFADKVDAIVETWFLGTQAGNAIANVLTGDYNPSGKLTMSFPAHVGQVPIYYNHFQTGRPLSEANQAEKYISKYIDGSNEPLYPFGFGLSYTNFMYSNLSLDKTTLQKNEVLKASITVSNDGDYNGIETVQLYIQDCHGSIVRPVKELKDFRQISLAVGESKDVHFTIDQQTLTYWTPQAGYVAESGAFNVYIGTNSQEVMSASFEYEG